MTDPVDSLLIDVRANTQGFASDVAAMRRDPEEHTSELQSPC